MYSFLYFFIYTCTHSGTFHLYMYSFWYFSFIHVLFDICTLIYVLILVLFINLYILFSIVAYRLICTFPELSDKLELSGELPLTCTFYEHHLRLHWGELIRTVWGLHSGYLCSMPRELLPHSTKKHEILLKTDFRSKSKIYLLSCTS